MPTAFRDAAVTPDVAKVGEADELAPVFVIAPDAEVNGVRDKEVLEVLAFELARPSSAHLIPASTWAKWIALSQVALVCLRNAMHVREELFLISRQPYPRLVIHIRPVIMLADAPAVPFVKSTGESLSQAMGWGVPWKWGRLPASVSTYDDASTVRRTVAFTSRGSDMKL
jgi:hypothetical protein